ncbi:MAG: diutan polysaccharide export protein [Pseudomonadota bacterium]
MILRRAKPKAPAQGATKPLLVAEGVVAVEGFRVATALIEAGRPSTDAGSMFHALATQAVQQHFSRGRRGLAVCGASAGTGVTFTSACLAAALAAAGAPVLLIETNLHQPSLMDLIRPDRPVNGLTDYLRGEASLVDVLQSEILPSLSVVFAGGKDSRGDELLISQRFRQFLDDCLRDYACVIVDTAPANRFADGRSVAIAVGYAAIVGRRQYSFINDTKLLARQLREAGVTVVGSIFNLA